MENENEKVTRNSDKLLKAMIVIMAVNLVVGIVNIGLVVNKNTSNQRPNNRMMRQEAMFDGFNRGGMRNPSFNNEPKCFMRNNNNQNFRRPDFNNNKFTKRESSNRDDGNFENKRRRHNNENNERKVPNETNNGNREKRQYDIRNDVFDNNQFQNY